LTIFRKSRPRILFCNLYTQNEKNVSRGCVYLPIFTLYKTKTHTHHKTNKAGSLSPRHSTFRTLPIYEEMIEYSREDILDLCCDCDLSPYQTIRFIKALEKEQENPLFFNKTTAAAETEGEDSTDQDFYMSRSPGMEIGRGSMTKSSGKGSGKGSGWEGLQNKRSLSRRKFNLSGIDEQKEEEDKSEEVSDMGITKKSNKTREVEKLCDPMVKSRYVL